MPSPTSSTPTTSICRLNQVDIDIEGSPCPVSGLTHRERELLKRSWRRMTGLQGELRDQFGKRITLWILNNIPNARERFVQFTQGSSPELETSPRFLETERKIAHAFDDVINNIYKPEYLHFKVRNIVVSHLKRARNESIGLEYFRPLRDKIPEFLRDEMAVDEQSEEAQLWGRLLNLFVQVMAEETDDQRRIARGATASGTDGSERKCCAIL